MTLQLPPTLLFQQYCKHEDGWSDHYGALQTAAAYGGLRMRPNYFIKAIWTHGCMGPWDATSPGNLFCNSPQAHELPIFVARQEEADYLHENGYRQARAIGVPIIYTPETGVERIPGSLLVMPTHTLTGAKFDDRRPFERYADEIKAIAPAFAKVTICVHPNCQKNGLWIKEFTDRGFEIIFGAQTNDLNALPRMRGLFEQFEHVTTNGWGSHIAYALNFGAKVSIYGTEIAMTEANALLDVAWSSDRTALKTALSTRVQDQRQEFLKRLYVHPKDGVLDVEWGRWFVGAKHKLSPDEMAGLMPALVDPAPTPVVPIPGQPAKPRILFVTHEASRTGAPMFLLHFLRWLRRHTDQDFDLLVLKPGALAAEFLKVATLHTPQTAVPNPQFLQAFDLIYANTCCNALQLEEWNYGEIPLITHAHELDAGYDWLGARSMAAVIKQSTRFIACARIVAERLNQRFSIPRERIGVHYEMIDDRRAAENVRAADIPALRKTYNLPENAFIVAACGTVDLRKAPDLFLQLALRLRGKITDRPLRFIWIGSANTPDLSMALHHDIRKLGLQDQFTFVGELPNPHALLSISDLFCLTSREDPFPLVMLEAASLARPVLCFDGAGGAAEFCAAGGGLASPYLDVEAMAQLAAELLRDPERRADIGRRAAETVQARFTIEKIAPALWQEVKGVLQAPPANSPFRSPDRSLADIYASWPAKEAPQRAYVAAQIARHRARKEARALAHAGKRKEAVQILLRAINADVATNDPDIVFEALLEISSDLAPLEPRQAADILAHAEGIAAKNPNYTLNGAFRPKRVTR